MPDKSLHVQENKDGTISVCYQPKTQGRHEVLVNHNETAVLEHPFNCVVDGVDDGFVTAYGSGLTMGFSGVETSFTAVTKTGSSSNLSVKIDGPSKIDVKRTDNKNGSTLFHYIPMSPGAYNIHILYRNKPVKGSPFTAKVSGEGRKRTQLSLGQTAEYSLSVTEPDIVDLVGVIKTPSGTSDPCILKKMANGQLGIASFTPREKGQYEVTVTRNGKNISKSPFKVNIADRDIAHAAKVNLSGVALSSAVANANNVIKIDTKNAGYGGLSVVMEGQHRSDIECTDEKERVYTIRYSPHEPGIYIVNVRYADEHVQGSPFLVEAKGEASGRKRVTASHDIAAGEVREVGSHCEFPLKIPGTNPFDMEASITDPSGATEVIEVFDEDDFRYKIRFRPKVKGIHTLSVKHKSLHVSGSPFQYSVGALCSGGGHKIQVGGIGLERGEVGRKNEFNVYTREAGAGQLTIAVEGADPTNIKFEDRGAGFVGVFYDALKPGIYGIHIKFNDQHIPNSPFMVPIAQDSGDAKKVTIHSLRDRGLEVKKPATFTVQFNGGKGVLHASVWTPSGEHEDCFIQEMDTDAFGVRFIPKENGVHYVHVLLNDAHIRDSPFALMVGSLAADPAMLHASGDGLSAGRTGSKSKFLVRTVNSGVGTLAVFIDGPSKVALSCREDDEGYEFSYTPFSPGKYLITIKYGNINIAGSPYQSTVTGTGRKPSPIVEQSSMVVETVEKKPGAKVRKAINFTSDAQKVIAKGNGLKKAFNNVNTNFTLDVKDAGHAMLAVAIIGEAGDGPAELIVKKTSATVYTVTYRINTAGDHTLSVKWGDDDIPGSPFHITT